jgi:hypothetical protein
VAAYAKISQDTIYSRYAVKTQESLQVPEIMRDENKTFIGQAISLGIRVLIKSKHPSLCIQVSQDLC